MNPESYKTNILRLLIHSYENEEISVKMKIECYSPVNRLKMWLTYTGVWITLGKVYNYTL